MTSKKNWLTLEEGINPRAVETAETAIKTALISTAIGAAILVLGIVYGDIQWKLILVSLIVALVSALVALRPYARRVRIYLDVRERFPEDKRRIQPLVLSWTQRARLVFPPVEDPYEEVFRIPRLLDIFSSVDDQFRLELAFPLQIRDLEKYATSAEVCEHLARVLRVHSVSVRDSMGNRVAYDVHMRDPLAC